MKRTYFDLTREPMGLRLLRSRQVPHGPNAEPLSDPHFGDEVEQFASEPLRKAWRDRLLKLRAAS